MIKATDPIKTVTIDRNIETLIAIGAAIASNCIPCFEHLYERAITGGLTTAEIKRASDIAGQVKKGAQAAISGSVDELIGDRERVSSPCGQAAGPSRCGC